MAPSKPHFPSSHPNAATTPPTSYTHFLFKSLFFALLLIALPLFPSQPPESLNHTILTKFWELIHLLFIGIVVSYGLFSHRRKIVNTIEGCSNVNDSQSYAARLFHVSSVFEDEFEIPFGPDEKNGLQSFRSQYCNGSSVLVGQSKPGSSNFQNGFGNSSGFNEKNVIFEDDFENPCGSDEENGFQSRRSQYFSGSSVFGEQSMPCSLNLENGFGNSCGYNEEHVIHAWNSQYFIGESIVTVANGSYVAGESGKPGSGISYKPLGLPVRSLRSRIRKSDSPKFVSSSESSSGRSASSKSSGKSRNVTFGELGPLNSEKKFSEGDAMPSPIPWRSRSGRMEMRENVGNATRPLHSRHLSVEESRFDQLQSRSFRSTKSLRSRTSSMSSSSYSLASELPNSEMKELGRKKSLHGSSSPDSSSPPKEMNGKNSLDASNSWRYSNSSLSEKDARRSFENEPYNLSRREDPCFKSEVKPANLVKASSRGKSVRTIRASGYTTEAMKVGDTCGNPIEDKVLKKPNEVEEVSMRKEGIKTGGLLSIGSSKQNLDNSSPLPKPTFSGYQNGKKQEVSENFCVEAEEESESDAEEESESDAEVFQVSSDEEVASEIMTDSNEVDQKAGEFIAKFREQIRLQKMASIERSRGLHIGGTYFR